MSDLAISAFSAAPAGPAGPADPDPSRFVNDVHSRLNACHVAEVRRPRSVAELCALLRQAARQQMPVAMAGGRHAMGGQQFVSGGLLLDMGGLDQVLSLDPQRGWLTVQAGIQWPALMAQLQAMQAGEPRPWVIGQKQTGADRFSLGGSLAANIHGRGLCMAPIVADVECITLVDAQAQLLRCSRTENAELFALAIGGYGLFGVIVTVTLRLRRRQQLQREVELLQLEQLMPAFQRRIDEGCVYGDFQFAIDPASPDFLQRGVFACYRPVPESEQLRPLPEGQMALRAEDWLQLLSLAHTRKTEAFERYASFYLASAGQRYWSDTHQMSYYLDDYHLALDAQLGHTGSEMISELYVPRGRLPAFMRAAAAALRELHADVVYGTVRLIERDGDSALPWAREAFACVVFNLHVRHDSAGLRAAAESFRCLIDLALAQGGSYYLCYHRHATAAQLRQAYPGIDAWLRAKRRHDPRQLFQSDWYRHAVALLAAADAASETRLAQPSCA